MRDGCWQCRRDDEYDRIFEATRPRFPNGRAPGVEEIPVTSTGRVLRFPMCLRGQTPCIMRAKRKRRR